jgi:hypothetical protein
MYGEEDWEDDFHDLGYDDASFSNEIDLNSTTEHDIDESTTSREEYEESIQSCWNIRIQLLPVYAYLRTLSLELRLSPFDVELFITAVLDDTLESTYETAKAYLLTEIHYKLLLVCLSLVQSCRQQWWQTSWCLLDRETWPQYLQPLLHLWSDDEYLADDCKDVIRIIDYYKRNNFNYFKYPASIKCKILNVLMAITLSSEVIAELMEQRENRPLNGDPFPQFKKGDDGYPDVCILCADGGDLLCCEYCPASFHRHCLHESNTFVFDGEWQCYECAKPDPLRSRGRLTWHPCRQGFMTIIGNVLLYKPSAKCSINDYIELKYSDVHKLIPEKSFESDYWKHFMYYVGTFLRNGWLYLGDDYTSNDDSIDFEENEIESTSSCMNSDKYVSVEEIDDYPDDGSSLSSVSRSNQKKRRSQGNHSQWSGKLSKKPKNNSAYTKAKVEYIRYDAMLSSSKTFKFSFADLKRLKDSGESIDIFLRYRNHYRDSKNSMLFSDLQSQLVASRSASKCTKSYMESINHAIGPLNGDRYWLSLPLTAQSFVMQLHYAEKIQDCCSLLYGMISSADKKVFRPEWFVSPIESEDCDFGRVRKITFEEGKSRRQAPKKSGNILRFYQFVKLERVVKSMNIDHLSPTSKAKHIRKLLPSHLNIPAQPEQSDSDDNNVADDGELVGNTEDSESVLSDNESNARNMENKQFVTGKRFMLDNCMFTTPKKYLKRLARLGGVGFLPNVAYSMQANTFASPPFHWYWKYRVLNCRSYDSLMLQMKYLEECLVERVQKRICPSTTSDLLSHSFSDGLIEPLSRGFIFKEKKKKKLKRSSFRDVFCAISRSPYYEQVTSSKMQNSFPSHLVNNAVYEAAPQTEYLLISEDTEISMTTVLHFEIDPSLVSSFKLRNWIVSVQESQICLPECIRFQSFINAIYDLISLSGYSENDEMMIYNEVHTAITVERTAAFRDILASLYVNKEIGLDVKILTSLVENLLNKAIIGVSELVKYDFVSALTEAKNVESVRRSNRGLSMGADSQSNDESNGIRTENGSIAENTLIKRYVTGPLKVLGDRFSDKDILRNKKSVASAQESKLVKQRVLLRKEVGTIDCTYCATTTVSSLSYVPQVGDEIIYYVTGHREYIKLYPDLCRLDRNGLVKKALSNEHGICCRILSIDYEFPILPTNTADKGLLMVILCGVCGNQSNVPVKVFPVLYRPGHRSAEFLVLRESIESTLMRSWQPEMLFTMFYEGGDRFSGKIVNIERDPSELCLWAGVKVFWESWGEDLVNEWELEIYEDPTLQVVEKMPKKSVSKKRNGVDDVIPSSHIPEKTIPEKVFQLNKTLTEIIDKYLCKPEFEAFRELVTGMSHFRPPMITIALTSPFSQRMLLQTIIAMSRSLFI